MVVKEVDNYEKYIGLFIKVGVSKKVIFVLLKDRVWKKFQVWEERFFFKVRKEVVIKAVG